LVEFNGEAILFLVGIFLKLWIHYLLFRLFLSFAVLRIEPRDLSLLSRHSTELDTSLGLLPFELFCIVCVFWGFFSFHLSFLIYWHIILIISLESFYICKISGIVLFSSLALVFSSLPTTHSLLISLDWHPWDVIFILLFVSFWFVLTFFFKIQ
jgi:hypothetical protein